MRKMLQRDPEPGDCPERQAASDDGVMILQFGQLVLADAADEQLQLVLVEQRQQAVGHQRVKPLQKLPEFDSICNRIKGTD